MGEGDRGGEGCAPHPRNFAIVQLAGANRGLRLVNAGGPGRSLPAAPASEPLAPAPALLRRPGGTFRSEFGIILAMPAFRSPYTSEDTE